MKRSIEILWHTGYWALYLILLLLFFLLLKITSATDGLLHGLTLWFKLMTGFAILPGVIGFYAAYLYLYPRFLVNRQMSRLLVPGLLCAVLAAVTGTVAIALLVTPSFLLDDNGTNLLFILSSVTLLALINVVIGSVMKGFVAGYNDINVKLQLSSRNHALELELIRLQLDPHFLFNTINNIDVMITKQPEQASAYLNRLSGIMRFMLYETKAGKMALSKELDYINQYIGLQRLRTGYPENIEVNILGDPSHWRIEPMLFMPFIENACKHYTRGERGFIRITINITATRLGFECINSCYPASTTITGIGKELIAKRLALAYPATHNLTYSKKDDTHSVKLSIWQ